MRRERWRGQHIAVVKAVQGVGVAPLGAGVSEVKEGGVEELTAVEPTLVRGLFGDDDDALTGDGKQKSEAVDESRQLAPAACAVLAKGHQHGDRCCRMFSRRRRPR